MGNNAIITVVGLGIIFLISNTTLNLRDRDAYDNTYGYVEYLAARDIARSSIQITLRDRKSTRLNSSHIQKSRMPSSA